MRALLFALLCVSCDFGIGSDPNPPAAPCLPGHARAPGSACSARSASIVADGKTGDWSALDSIPLAQSCVTPPCDGLLMDSLQAARFTDGGWPVLAIRVHTAGGVVPTSRNDTRRLELHFAALSGEFPTTEDVFYVGQSSTGWLRAGREQGGASTPYAYGWTADGLELTVPTDFLSFDGAMTVTVAGAAFDGTNWSPITTQAAPARVCWFDGPAGKDDPCAQ